MGKETALRRWLAGTPFAWTASDETMGDQTRLLGEAGMGTPAKNKTKHRNRARMMRDQ
jgi:hypothetical protein